MTTDVPPGSGPARIAAELRELGARKATGVYYAVSDDNRQVRIGIVDGMIESIVLRGADWRQALEILARMNVVRTRFGANEPRPHAGGDVPDIAGVVRVLLQPSLAAAAPTAAAPTAAQAAAVTPATASTPATVRLTAAAHRAIRDILTDYLGPISGIVYEDHQSAGLDGQALLERLASEIPDSRQAADFLARARQNLSLK